MLEQGALITLGPREGRLSYWAGTIIRVTVVLSRSKAVYRGVVINGSHQEAGSIVTGTYDASCDTLTYDFISNWQHMHLLDDLI